MSEPSGTPSDSRRLPSTRRARSASGFGAGAWLILLLVPGLTRAAPSRQSAPESATGGAIKARSSAAASAQLSEPPTPDDLARLGALLADPAATAEDRRSAAATLAAALAQLSDVFDGPPAKSGSNSPAERLVREALGASLPAASRLAVAEQVALRVPAPPRSLTPSLAACLDPADPALTTAALRALARYQSRDAIRPILDGLLAPDSNLPAESPIRIQAFETLWAQTGLVELGTDLSLWRQWWSKAQWLSEPEWRTRISRSQAAAAETLRRQRIESLRLLTDLYRRLHSAAPEGARSDLLAEMMASGEAEVRKLGVDLAMRALLNGKQIDDTVAASVASLLSDPSAPIREAAASVLDRLNRPALAPAIRRALAAERDPAVAAALMRAASHEPDDALVAAALGWLAHAEVGTKESPTADSAFAALLAAHDAGIPQRDGAAEIVRDRLLALPPQRLTLAGLRLLTRLGEAARVAQSLDSPDGARALLAASALVDDEGSTDALVAAAARNPALRDAALRSLTRWRPTAEGFADARALVTGEDPAAREALVQYARVLPPAELLTVARRESDARFREELLAHAVTPDYLGRVAEPLARIDLLSLAIQTRLALGRAADALGAIDATPAEWLGPRLRALRVTSLICLDRVEDALDYTKQSAELGADAAMLRAWVDGLTYSIDKPYARRIHDALLAAYPEAPASAEGARFLALVDRLPPLPTPIIPPIIPPAAEQPTPTDLGPPPPQRAPTPEATPPAPAKKEPKEPPSTSSASFAPADSGSRQRRQGGGGGGESAL